MQSEKADANARETRVVVRIMDQSLTEIHLRFPHSKKQTIPGAATAYAIKSTVSR